MDYLGNIRGSNSAGKMDGSDDRNSAPKEDFILFIRLNQTAEQRLSEICSFLKTEAAALGGLLKVAETTKLTICSLSPSLSIRRAFRLAPSDSRQSVFLDSVFVRDRYVFLRLSLSGVLTHVLANYMFADGESFVATMSNSFIPVGVFEKELSAHNLSLFLNKLKKSSSCLSFQSTDLRILFGGQRFVLAKSGNVHVWLKAESLYSFETMISKTSIMSDNKLQDKLIKSALEAESLTELENKVAKSTFPTECDDDIQVLAHYYKDAPVIDSKPKRVSDPRIRMPSHLPHIIPEIKKVNEGSSDVKTDPRNILVDVDSDNYWPDEDSSSGDRRPMKIKSEPLTPVSRLKSATDTPFSTPFQSPGELAFNNNLEKKLAEDGSYFRNQARALREPQPVTSTPGAKVIQNLGNFRELLELTTSRMAELERDPSSENQEKAGLELARAFEALSSSFVDKPTDDANKINWGGHSGW